MGDSDIVLHELTKIFQTGIFKRKTGVENLSLAIPRGEIVGLLGANGSGKSTTLKMVLGFLQPTRGTILICGKRGGTRESRQLIGYLPENPRFQKFLTGKDILRYFGRLLGMGGAGLEKRADFLLDLVGLGKAGLERVQGYSKGMTQRLAIAQSLLNQPKILIFDEPMSGLDPLGRMEIRTLIQRVHREMDQSTIFFTTHILSDVEALCSSVALLKKGKLEVFCPISQLLNQDSEHYSLTAASLPESLRSRYLAEGGTASPLGITIEVSGTDRLTAVVSEISNAGARVVGLNSKRRGLEEALFSDLKLSLGGAA
jgi:ABC-2 type transport system ATP-binding protein